MLSYSFNHFQDLSLTIPQGPVAGSRGRAGGGIGQELDLNACLAQFTEPETLSGKDSWVCPRCKRAVAAVKTLSIFRPPKVLVLHLKARRSEVGKGDPDGVRSVWRLVLRSVHIALFVTAHLRKMCRYMHLVI